jgi:hypothetical protein
MRMSAAKPAKKSESIEIRLSYEAKTAFMDRCRLEDRTASEAIRLFIDDQIALPAVTPQQRPSHWRAAVGLLIGMAMGLGVAAPSLARASQQSRASFEQLDRNRDGVLSYEEFRGR